MPAKRVAPKIITPSGHINFFAFKEIFSITEDTDYRGTIEALKKGIEFRGLSVWTLIFAVFIASIGLNTNSTAVIIGAMLISPIMGPIMGCGLALGTYDFDLLKRAARNLLIMTVTGLVASTLYFFISPLADAQSELLARTFPTIYDVLIAIFGGATGILAGSRKDKFSNAIPGVAIATALMPPLCTAGYGIANGNLSYFVGALYLYLINSIFIGITTFGFIRYFKFRKEAGVHSHTEKRIRKYVYITAILVMLPSVYMAYDVVAESTFQKRARAYVVKNFMFDKSRIINTKYTRTTGSNKIELTIIGEPISEEMIAHLKKQMSTYDLAGTELTIIQAEKYQSEQNAKTTGLPGVANNKSKDDQLLHLEQENKYLKSRERLISSVSKEVNVLFPEIASISFGDLLTEDTQELNQTKGPSFLVKWKRNAKVADKKRLELFIKLRLGFEKIDIIEIH